MDWNYMNSWWGYTQWIYQYQISSAVSSIGYAQAW